MNKVEEHNNIQSVLARLVTNPHVAESLILDRKAILQQFGLSALESKQLEFFFDQYLKKFIASSRLLKKKRWDDLCASMQLLNKIIQKEQFSTYWESYLDQKALYDVVPKNPLIESISFCQFLQSLPTFQDPIFYGIAQYEILRNTVIINYSTNFNAYVNPAVDINYIEKNNDKYTALFLHPCAKIETFSYNISDFILEISHARDIVHFTTHFLPEKQRLLCYKNWVKGGVGTIKLGDLLESIFNVLMKPRLVSWNELYESDIQTSPENIKLMILNLEKAGVLIIIDKFKFVKKFNEVEYNDIQKRY